MKFNYIGIDGNTTYLSGHACGNYLVLETNHQDFHLFNIDDALNPEFLMLLPGTSDKYISLITTDNGLYHCVSENKLIIPMREISCLENEIGYLFYYDLTKPRHSSLIQKLLVGQFKEMKSLKVTYLGDIGFIYLLTNKDLIAVKSVESYFAVIPSNEYENFVEYPNIVFKLFPEGGQFGLTRNITFNGVRSGYMLQPICGCKKLTIDIHSVDSDSKLFINFDQYFTGYRSNITFYVSLQMLKLNLEIIKRVRQTFRG